VTSVPRGICAHSLGSHERSHREAVVRPSRHEPILRRGSPSATRRARVRPPLGSPGHERITTGWLPWTL